MAIPSFIFGGDAAAKTPQELAQQRAVIHALMASQKAPRNVGEGLNALGDGIVANVLGRRADAAEAAGQSSAESAFSPIVGALAGFPAAPGSGASSSAAASDTPSYRDAIASVESAGSGDYSAVGPTNKKLGRALGRYQIMEANIGPWAKEALGREVTPDEFMADPKIQDAIFDHKFGSYVQKYGNPQDAASAWFTGQPLSVGADRKDVLGTSGAGYVDKFNRALGGQPAPVQVASNDPGAGVAQALAGKPDGINPVAAGQPVSGDATTQRVLATMGNPQSMTGGAPMPLQGQPQQVAQAAPTGPDLSRIPVTAGGNAGALPPGAAQAGPSIAQLLAAGGNQWLNGNQSAIVNALLGQKLKEQDPGTALNREKTQLEIDQLRNPTVKPTGDMQEYEFAKSQGFPGSFVDFQLAQKKAGATNITNSVGGNSSKFIDKSDEAAAKRFDDIVAAGQTAPQTMADMQQLIDLGAQIGTGKGAQIKAALGPYAQSLGIDVQGLDEIQAYQAITSRLAPQMRAVGSGSSSDRDVSMFLQSLPNLRNAQGGNELIANTMKSVAQNKQNAAEIASKAQRGEISWQDADKQIRELPNPYELFKNFQKETQDGKATGNRTSSGVQWSIEP